MKQSTQDAIDQHLSNGFKFGDSEVTSELAEDAVEWLGAYQGNFSYVLDMKSRKQLSIPQIRGLLNCMLAERRNAQKAVEEEKAPVDLKTATVRNGYFTVVLDDGARHTIRIRPGKGDNASTQYVKYMTGPDNEHSYTYCGFIRNGQFRWAQGTFEPTLRKAMTFLIRADDDRQEEFGKAYALDSGNCYICGRLLTTPESIVLGIGPICNGKAA